MMKKNFYSTREGIINRQDAITIDDIKELFRQSFYKFKNDGYFQEYFGFDTVHLNSMGSPYFIKGKLGDNIEAIILKNIYKNNLYPIEKYCYGYSEDDLFDIIEFVYMYCSKGIDGIEHNYKGNTMIHFDVFDKNEGRKDFRKEINSILEIYKNGFELSESGEILKLPDTNYKSIFEAEIPTSNSKISDKINYACNKFRKPNSTIQNRHEALRTLVDVLELLRPQIRKIENSKKDDDLLFEIANKFSIRHYNDKQHDLYDKDIWYNWMFYIYLSSIHAFLRILRKQEIDIV